MIMRACSDRLKSTDPGGHAGIDVAAKADPCPISSHGESTHEVTINNQRPASLYSIEVVARSVSGRINVNFHHSESVIPAGKKRTPSYPMAGCAGTENSTDEIETTIEFYDGTQRVSGNTFSGSKESIGLSYQIDIIP